MPGGDGTGPMGMGPMTGRGAGYCAGFAAPGSRTKRNSRRNTSPTVINHKDFTPGELKSAVTDLERMDANRAKAKEKSVKRLVRDIARRKGPLLQGGPDA